MPQQIDASKLKKAEASATLAKNMITQAIEQSSANPLLAEEALKQASTEISQVQTMISQAQQSQSQSAQQQQK
ncbi:MAG: hypothetical protein ACM32O_13040 [Clostridia bacterium]